MIRRLIWVMLALVTLSVAAITGFLYWQSREDTARAHDGNGAAYVALGSSYAAGMGLGNRAGGSPVQCMRGDGGYPSLVAKALDMPLLDMSCSGSTTEHVLQGGQFFLGPQLAAVGPETRLVTITTGGNDVGYIGDLMATSGAMGTIGAWFHGAIKPSADRPYDRVAANFVEIVVRVRAKAPNAQIVIVNYPPLFPESGTCAALGITDTQLMISRDVERRLAQATKQAARQSGATYVDMATTGAGHDVCAKQPWVNGKTANVGAPFHPNADGAKAVADAIVAAVSR